MAGLLRSFGMSAAIFESADALLVAGVKGFDCIVSDLQMPGTSGLELGRILNAQELAVPVIIMTGFPERLKHDRRIGEDFPLIEKPVDSRELVACIESILARRVD